MKRGTSKALWALGLIGAATGVGTAIYYATKPKAGTTPDTNANLPPLAPPGENGGGGGGGGLQPSDLLKLSPAYWIGKKIGQAVSGSKG